MRRLSLLAALLAPSVALAGPPIVVWEYTDFPAPAEGQDYSPVAGTDGWVNGYAADPWSGTRTGQYLFPITDDNVGFRGEFGDGGPADNWLIHDGDFENGGIWSRVGNTDDDAVGLVLSHDGDDTYYLVFHTSNSTPPGIDAVRGPTLVLLRIEDGQVTRLGRNPNVARLGEQTTELRFNRDGGRLLVYLGPDLALNVTDPDPLPPGRAGVWSYDCGADGDTCFFDVLSAYQLDTDGDGTPDDEEGQGGGDTDVTDTDAGDTDVVDTDPSFDTDDTDVGTVDTDGPDVGVPVDEELTAGCEGCSGAQGGALSAGWLVLGAAVIARRRARRPGAR